MSKDFLRKTLVFLQLTLIINRINMIQSSLNFLNENDTDIITLWGARLLQLSVTIEGSGTTQCKHFFQGHFDIKKTHYYSLGEGSGDTTPSNSLTTTETSEIYFQRNQKI